MSRIVLELEDGGGAWTFEQPTVLAGRLPECDLALDSSRFATASRRHFCLHLAPNLVEIEDLGSSNGTWVNHRRVQRQRLQNGDRIGLSEAGGPLLLVKEIAGMPLAATVVAAPSPAFGAASAATIVTPARPARTVPPPSPFPNSTPTVVTPARGEALYSPQPATVKSGEQPAAARADADSGAAMNQKLRGIQRLLFAVLVLNVALTVILLTQISRTQDMVQTLQTRADNAVALFQPQLDDRMNKLDKRLDQAQVSMKQSQDAFAARMRHELPQVMDQYLNGKMRQLGKNGNLEVLKQHVHP